MFGLFFVAYPLGYFFLTKPFDNQFKRLEEGILEGGIPFFSWGFRVTSFAWDIVLQPYRHKKIKNRLVSRFIQATFRHQERIYGKVDFRGYASRFQLILAYTLTYGVIFFLLWGYLFLLHDFVLFREFARARRG